MPEIPGVKELVSKRAMLPRTLIFCQRCKECTEIYHCFKSALGDAFTEPAGSLDLSFLRLVDMFLGATGRHPV